MLAMVGAQTSWQEDISEFQTNLVYTAISRPTRAT